MPAKAEKIVFSAALKGGITMNDYQLTETIERYLLGRMSPGEIADFEQLRKEHTEIEALISEQRQFIGLLKHYGERSELERRLNAIHQEIDVHALVEQVTIHPAWIVKLWRNHHSKISVAASVAIFAILSTMFFTGYFNNANKDSLTQLSLQVRSVNIKTNNLSKATSELQHIVGARGETGLPTGLKSFSGYIATGFAITSNGYIATSYHVIDANYDSIYVQNADGRSFRARFVSDASSPAYGIAILKIDDPEFEKLPAIPYTLKKGISDLGESVYTYGFPGINGQLGEGYLAAERGYNSDSTEYQVSIPVNPGNSGGPLMDTKGNLIGVINSKQERIEGAHFAVKSLYLLKTIQNIESDSLRRTINLNTKNTLTGLTHTQQIKKVQDFVFMIKVYKN